ncbi:SIR2 family protein [Halocynthiibacter sp.]|uniref:SIR2 family protein n=1 Tax=Halocynthiibacter sp. TaxID=1979210 RepID=UPI003C524643
MSRKLIIIGNGLGMALSPEHFSLQHVMPEVWNNDLNDAERTLIASCIEGIEETGPTSEDRLMPAQLAQFAHELITGIVENNKQDEWFTANALKYPEAIGKYVYNVAQQLNKNSEQFENDIRLKSFYNSFIPFLDKSKSHVATLNYDTLLYSAFNEYYEVGSKIHRICNGYSGSLVDGYLERNGFDKNNFERQFNRTFGYYLHLHGSPLFTGTPGKKILRRQLSTQAPGNARHIILSDGRLKRHLIDRSDILTMYWEMLKTALDEASEVILFGYGGGDEHLNELLRGAKVSKRVVVRDKGSADANQSAKQEWLSRLSHNEDVIDHGDSGVSYEPMDNILEFRDW